MRVFDRGGILTTAPGATAIMRSCVSTVDTYIIKILKDGFKSQPKRASERHCPGASDKMIPESFPGLLDSNSSADMPMPREDVGGYRQRPYNLFSRLPLALGFTIDTVGVRSNDRVSKVTGRS